MGACIVVAAVLAWPLRKILKKLSFGSLLAGFKRIAHWEFWPPAVFYLPVIAKYLLLAIRYRSLSLPTLANRALIGPGIFGSWVTGAITASGGAWNASIVSELVSWGNTTLKANGLGAYISEATAKGDWPRIVLGVGLMSVFVVSLNRLVWRPLYDMAESKYRLG